MSGAQAPRAGGNGRPKRPIAKYAIGIVFLCALTITGAWVMRGFTSTPKQAVVLPPETVQQSRMAAAPPMPRDIAGAAAARTGPNFKGNVIDAQTRQPIADFTVHVGYYGKPRPLFGNEPARDFHGGTYALTPTLLISPDYNWVIRIDAPGHLPATSDAQQGSGEVNFELQPGKDIQGVVLDSAGAPVAGANIVMATATVGVNFNPSDWLARSNGINSTSGSDGQFSLPPEAGNIDVAAISDKGFAEVNQNPSGGRIVLRLSAWGSISGKLMTQGKPGANQQIHISNLPNPTGAHISTSASIQTDADGNYHIDQVIPSQYRINSVFHSMVNVRGVERHMVRIGQSEIISVASGQPLIVNFGGTGRPVAGKVILPAGVSSADYTVQVNISPASTGRPIVNYLAAAASDGAFRVEDVEPGDYQMTVIMNPDLMNVTARTAGRRPAQPFQTKFTVDPIPGGGYSDEPLVLPDIKLGS